MVTWGREVETVDPRDVELSCSYIRDVKVTWVAQPAPLGVGEAKGLHDPVVGQRLLLGCGDARVGEVVAC